MAVAGAEAGQIYSGYGHGHHDKRVADPKSGYGHTLTGHIYGKSYGKRSADPLLFRVYPLYKREAEAGGQHSGYGRGHSKREAKPEPGVFTVGRVLFKLKLLQQSQS